MAIHRFRDRRQPCLRAVALHEDFDGRDVRKLVEALQYGNRYTRPDTRAALTCALPRLRATDAARLTEDHWVCLCSEIERCHYRRDGDFLKALLQAIELAGPPSALRHVHYLADSDSPVLKRTGIQAAAQACLVVLRGRAERERVANTLLRPAAEPKDLACALLRPARGEADTDAGLLLRPRAVEQAHEATDSLRPSS